MSDDVTLQTRTSVDTTFYSSGEIVRVRIDCYCDGKKASEIVRRISDMVDSCKDKSDKLPFG